MDGVSERQIGEMVGNAVLQKMLSVLAALPVFCTGSIAIPMPVTGATAASGSKATEFMPRDPNQIYRETGSCV